jgi:hypothetical protein
LTTLTNAIGSAAHQEVDGRAVEMLLFHYYEI